MSLISDSMGVLRSRETKIFVEQFREQIDSRILDIPGKDALALLREIKNQLAREEVSVNRTASALEDVLQSLAEPADSSDLSTRIATFHLLAADQFRSRASVSTFHAHYSRFMELLITHATTTAAAMLAGEGIVVPRDAWCVLASGELGRYETSSRRLGRIILLAADFSVFSRDSFNLFAYRTLAVLEPLFIAEEKRTGAASRQFWSGSVAEWLELVDAGLRGGDDGGHRGETLVDESLLADTFCVAADLRPLCGSPSLADSASEKCRARIAAELPKERFLQFAKRTTAMPVALGIFGRFKTAKRGVHRGEFSLDALAISPLVAAVRVLAVLCGVTATSTVERIKAILATGNLGVAFADRLLIAYHEFMTTLIELELSATADDGEPFFNPSTLDESTREFFRSGLEEVTTLQRIVYQHLAEVD